MRLADPQQGRRADEGARRTRCSPRARCATSATRSRSSSPRRSLQAKDAAELVEVDYDELPAVIDMQRRRLDRHRACTTTVADNICYDWGHGDKAAVDAAFAKAAHVTKLIVRQQPADPERDRAARRQRRLQPQRRELHALRRQPEPARRAAADVRLRARPAGVEGARDRARRRRRLRLEDLPLPGRRRAGLGERSGSAGRSSGPPSAANRSSPTRTAATTSPPPSSRSTRNGNFLALRVKTIANMGAYLSTFASAVPTILYAHAARRPVQDAGDLRRGQGGVHQHRAGRRLPRRRPTRGDLHRRAHRRAGGARDEDRPGRDPAAATSSPASRTRRRSA